MYTLTNEELEQLLIETDSFYNCPDEDAKQRMRDSYRTAEAESNQQIAEAGGITKWYDSGRGRLLHF